MFEKLTGIADAAGLSVVDQHRLGIFKSIATAFKLDRLARATRHVANKDDFSNELRAPVVEEIVYKAVEGGKVFQSD